MTILVTGGAGYIGSHTALALLEAGYSVVVLDNLANASRESLARVGALAERTLTFVEGDIRDRGGLDRLLNEHEFSAVIHFAGLKAVGESVSQPLGYYENNVSGTVTLCQAMQAAGVFKLVFSSSATVYGDEHPMPLHEGLPTGKPTNPYGRSKLMVEEVLQDLAHSDTRWSIARLRYFNPVGAHESGQIGEDPQGIPNNLLPYVAQVAVGRRDCLAVYGNDYATPDGTGVRDYIHVMDLAEGHLCALNTLLNNKNDCYTWNLGTGQGYSVLEVIDAFERASGVTIPYRIESRRPGDVATCWSDPTLAERELVWKAKRDLTTMMVDTWRWQQRNPQGYR
ncbi:UDP-glucose 4-epimerase GalE [Halomonas sp. PAMB 3264]|uniref:UDP-glucose 4-epimerase GalE n=1 Tax=Halomonas sp. PAMB 3264 TaxID=3075222 RepID=UPI00289BF581|nr:UDP-glucose 4-epimerase GalE [Halomonas sp. PAMB 3264]WNL42937.1 UDP-glucose 4-epimerase GalE [Halomonas sp. PAMB 3264]